MVLNFGIQLGTLFTYCDVKISQFSVTQILREINFQEFGTSKQTQPFILQSRLVQLFAAEIVQKKFLIL